MPHALTIRIKKNPGGGASLSCTRVDGTVTWHRHSGAQAAFFPRHDLTHYAVETVLSTQRGFYTLVADGWDLSDFGTPSPRGKVPADADIVEAIVGFLDLERSSGTTAGVNELNAYIASRSSEQGCPNPTAITVDELQLIRRKRAELFAKWHAVRAGDTLELSFP